MRILGRPRDTGARGLTCGFTMLTFAPDHNGSAAVDLPAFGSPIKASKALRVFRPSLYRPLSSMALRQHACYRLAGLPGGRLGMFAGTLDVTRFVKPA